MSYCYVSAGHLKVIAVTFTVICVANRVTQTSCRSDSRNRKFDCHGDGNIHVFVVVCDMQRRAQ